MERTGTVKLAKLLKILMTITFICNLIILPMVPGVVMMSILSQTDQTLNFMQSLQYLPQAALTAWVGLPFWGWEPFGRVLVIFLLFCGSCTAVILWQARGVLGTVVKQDTFTTPNAKRMKIAAICCILIGSAALLRTIWGFFFYQSIQPLFTYNALFIPIFVMGGLLCMVMSALFRQAAELKEENDLTI